MYVHAGGKIEALGTVVDERWARGRRRDAAGGSGDAAAADKGSGSGSPAAEVPMMAVSTVCTLDVRNNTGDGSTAAGNPPALANSGGRVGGGNQRERPVTGPSSNTALVVRQTDPSLLSGPLSEPAATAAGGEQNIARRKLTPAEKAARLKRQAEKQKALQKEAGWAGSSGGLTSNGLPPINRSGSSGGEGGGGTGGGAGGGGGRTEDDDEVAATATEEGELSYVERARLAAASVLPGKAKKKKKQKEPTAFEKRLQASPLMQNQGGKDKGKLRALP